MAYTKPLVIAGTKGNGNFSAGCVDKYGGYFCELCRCS